MLNWILTCFLLSTSTRDSLSLIKTGPLPSNIYKSPSNLLEPADGTVATSKLQEMYMKGQSRTELETVEFIWTYSELHLKNQ